MERQQKTRKVAGEGSEDGYIRRSTVWSGSGNLSEQVAEAAGGLAWPGDAERARSQPGKGKIR